EGFRHRLAHAKVFGRVCGGRKQGRGCNEDECSEAVGWAKSLATLSPRGQPRVSDFAHADRPVQSRGCPPYDQWHPSPHRSLAVQDSFLFSSRSAFPEKIFCRSLSGISSFLMLSIVGAMGPSGVSVANTTCSAPKNSSPQRTACTPPPKSAVSP